MIILTNFRDILWFGIGITWLGMGIYVICSFVFESVDHAVITPTKTALYGEPIKKIEPPPWVYGHVLTEQENQDLIYIMNTAMQMLSEHKPFGKQDFFTKIDVELDDYSSEAEKLIYQKGVFNLILEHYEYVSSLKLDYYNKYAWVPGSRPGRGYYRTLNDEEKESIHNAKGEIINRLRKRQIPWSNSWIRLVSNDAKRETLTPDSIITSWNADTFKNDLNLTLLEKKITSASDGDKCDKGEYIYTWNKDPTVEVSFYMNCIEPNKVSQDLNFIPNNFMISLKQNSKDSPEMKAHKEQEKKDKALQLLGVE